MKNSRLSKMLFTFLVLSSICGNSQNRIVGGEEVFDREQVPYIAALYRTTGNSFFCGATIIKENYLITAAHCVEGKNANDIFVKTGIANLDESGQTRLVSEIIVHPEYENYKNDIAILRLSKPLTLSEKVKIIPYATDADKIAGRMDPGVVAKTSGWGETEIDADDQAVLRTVNVPIVSLEVANGALSYDGTLFESMLPAGYAEGGKDACQGDSGGPLVVPDATGTGYILAGVVSFGRKCAKPNLYGIYARVSYFQDWIEKFLSGSPVSSFTINKYLETDIPFEVVNKSNNYFSSQKWTLKSENGSLITTSDTKDFNFSISMPGTYTLTLKTMNGILSDEFTKSFIVLKKSNSCDGIQYFDPQNLKAISEVGGGTASSLNAIVVGIKIPTTSKKIEKIFGATIFFKTPIVISPSSTSIIRLVLGAYDLFTKESETFALKVEKLADIYKEINATGKYTFVFETPFLLEENDKPVAFALDFSDSNSKGEEITILSSASTNSNSIYLEDELADLVTFSNLELGFKVNSCIYNFDELSVGLNNTIPNSEVALFPNPVKDEFVFLSTSNFGNIEIYELDGTKVLDLANVSNNTHIDVSSLYSGVYLWRFVSIEGEKIIQGKLVIE